jgi:hypothetical protein
MFGGDINGLLSNVVGKVDYSAVFTYPESLICPFIHKCRGIATMYLKKSMAFC